MFIKLSLNFWNWLNFTNSILKRIQLRKILYIIILRRSNVVNDIRLVMKSTLTIFPFCSFRNSIWFIVGMWWWKLTYTVIYLDLWMFSFWRYRVLLFWCWQTFINPRVWCIFILIILNLISMGRGIKIIGISILNLRVRISVI